ncbi:ABC transporter ATP-binding protein/permease [Synechococcus sp. HK05]|uniref:ABC transporter ATP-binding protein n=1 Tax=Synechococcus sp. HK05 TaxID=2725975 RepID=UPI001C38BA72|nr:ABC transporter ATP-binding protein [Synechococcus sp. HK05]MBV2350336.1 ABC transporter ATP-binding protein/permease [Synechococcus sp. HK05]
MQPLWQALSPRRRRQLLSLQILSLAAAAGEVANLGALLPVLRLLANPTKGLKALGPLATPLRALPEQHLLLSLGMGFVLVVALSTTLRVITIRSQLRLAALIAADLGEQVFAAVLQKPFSWHLEHNSSTVLAHVTKDIDQVSGGIQALLLVLVNFAIVLLLGGSLIALAPGLMPIIGFLMAGFYLLVFSFTRGTLTADGQRLTSNYQSTLQVVQESLGGIRDVLIESSQPFFLEAYRGRNRSYRLAAAAINTKAQVPRYMIEGFAVVLIVGLALTLALRGQSIEQQLPLLGTLALGAYRLLQPLQQCFSGLSSLQVNQSPLQRLQPFLCGPHLTQTGQISPALRLPATTNAAPLLKLHQLSFRYSPEGPWVLRDLELAIQPGERIAFVGSTGSGKSTTSDLILGLLEPTQGRLLVYGQDLQATPGLLAAWQRRVGHVPQSIYLSDASFASNIAFGVPEAQIDERRVRQAAEQAQIAELIESSSEGYATVVGERGVRLSGGQRQRIGLARALYKQAELLVLDEATSALDNYTEELVMAAIEALNRQITVILIAHRLSTVQRCDRILVLEHGRIVGLGSYGELLAGNSVFQLLARRRELFSA